MRPMNRRLVFAVPRATVLTVDAASKESGRRVTNEPQPRGRIDAIDIARGVALVAMAIYHFTWDLEFFGYVPPAMTAVGGWKLFARCIASSFLFLVGVSLFLGHARGIRWKGFLRRLAMVAGAALAITLVTYIAVPTGFIFFGILHQIALASVLGLAFLRLPAVVTLLAAAAVIAAPHYLRSAFLRRSLVVVDGPLREPAALQRLRAGIPVVRRCARRHRGGEDRRTDRPVREAGHAARAALDLAAHLRRTPQPGGLSYPPAGADRLRLAVLAGLSAGRGNARGSLPAILREQPATSSATPNSARAIVSACSTRWSARTRSKASMPASGAKRCSSRVEDIAGRCTVETDNAMLEGGDQ